METTPDPKLLEDARAAAIALLAVLEGMPPYSTTGVTRDKIYSARRWASTASAKLMEYECQMIGASHKEERG